MSEDQNTQDIQRLLDGEVWVDVYPLTLTSEAERTWVDGEDALGLIEILATAIATGARVVMMDVTGADPVHPLNVAEAIWIGEDEGLIDHLRAMAIAKLRQR